MSCPGVGLFFWLGVWLLSTTTILLHVLHLFAHLFDHGLHVDDSLSHFSITAFGTDRIRCRAGRSGVARNMECARQGRERQGDFNDGCRAGARPAGPGVDAVVAVAGAVELGISCSRNSAACGISAFPDEIISNR